MVGEIEIFNQVPFMSSVEALTGVTVITINREWFLAWLKLDHNFNAHFIKKSVEISYHITKKDEFNNLYSIHDLICKHLIEKSSKGKKF